MNKVELSSVSNNVFKKCRKKVKKGICRENKCSMIYERGHAAEQVYEFQKFHSSMHVCGC